jgi:hypothetical protein
VTIDTSGNVGIDRTPTHILHINGVGRSTQSTWATSSDERVKENIVDHEDALILVNALKPRRFNFNKVYRPNALESEAGFIAQEFATVVPEAVTKFKEDWITTPEEKDSDGNITTEEVKETIEDFNVLNTSCLLPMLVKAVQELSAKVTALENA